MSEYTTPLKITHRATVARLANMDRAKGAIIYLDDASGGGTKFFLKEGIDKSRLVPINYDVGACRQILEKSGVFAVHSDVDDFVLRTSRRVSITWLDLQSTTVKAETLKAAVDTSPFVMLTLSTRAVSPDATMRDVERQVSKFGGQPLETARYRGKGGVMNVLKFIAKGRPHKRKGLCAGRELHIPKGRWKSTYGYDKIKRTPDGKSLVFHVADVSKDVTLRGVMTNDALHSECEAWKLTRDQAEAYAVLK